MSFNIQNVFATTNNRFYEMSLLILRLIEDILKDQ